MSLLLLPADAVSVGVSRAVYGLFAVSTLPRLASGELDWRKVVEVVVLGEFVVGKVGGECGWCGRVCGCIMLHIWDATG